VTTDASAPDMEKVRPICIASARFPKWFAFGNGARGGLERDAFLSARPVIDERNRSMALLRSLPENATLPDLRRTYAVAARARAANDAGVGFLSSGSPATFGHFVTAFRRGLNEAGYVEHRNVGVEYLWSEGQNDRLPALANDLVRARVSVICAGGPCGRAGRPRPPRQQSHRLHERRGPGQDRLGGELHRPGGNVTGVAALIEVLGAKRLGLLREVVRPVR